MMIRVLPLMGAIVMMVGCTSDPNAPINQTFPIRQMDAFFRPFTGSQAPAPTYAGDPPYVRSYTNNPGYAPAYPPAAQR
jgi:hypothetical protein